ncbi:bifunctional diguanylate cyclase/phosphodiesterase [Paenibacillus cremeus]|nr:bifunctional diguanylate cyclase/phosphodiesterase [Paenibacillus cremeus]
MAVNIMDEKFGPINSLFQGFLESTTDGVLICDKDTKVIMANPAFQTMFGWEFLDLAGKDHNEIPIFSVGQRDEGNQLHRKLVTEGHVSNYITKRMHRNGSDVHVSVSLTIVEHLQSTSYIAIYRDITSLVNSRIRIRDSEQCLRSLYEHHSEPVFTLDLEGRITDCNSLFLQQSGFSAQEILGMPFMPLISPTDINRTMNHFNEAKRGRKQRYGVTVIDKMGRCLELDVTNIPIQVNGEIVGVYGITKDITELKKVQRQLRDREQHFKSLFNHLPDAVFSFDLHGNFTGANAATEKLLGYNTNELKGFSFKPFVLAEDLPDTANHFKLAAEGNIQRYATRGIDKKGRMLDLDVTNLPIYVDGEIVGVFGIVRDMTDIAEAQRKMEESERRYRKLVELSPSPIIVYSEGKFVYMNDAAAKCFGTNDPEDIYGKPVLAFVHPEFHQLARERSRTVTVERETLSWEEMKLLRVDGSIFDAETIGTTIEIDGKTSSLLIIRDVTERKKAEAIVTYLANHDILTAIPNRLYFKRLLEQRLKQHATGMLVFIDLDRFKAINDTFGHSVGDLLLQQVGQRLVSVNNRGIFCRQGGDEFISFFSDIEEIDAASIALEMIEKLSRPYEIDGTFLDITPSVGISMYPKDSNFAEMLIKQADAALYAAKEKGRNTYEFFSKRLEEKNERKAWIGTQLRKAIEFNEFELHFQPKHNVQSKVILGVEALIRWQHPEMGIISPDQFIPVAEETRLILPIGEWVLRTACKQAKQWSNQGHSLVISVNVSVQQFLQEDFVTRVQYALAESGLSPEFLNLEITESLPMFDFDTVIVKLNQIKSLGVTISLDDFGTGYSSLSYLSEIPFDYVKIDKSFVKHIHTHSVHSSIIQSVISIAHTLNRKVVAEGVECEETLHFLQESGCDEVQGFYLHPPLTSVQMEKLLQLGRYS